VAPPPPRPPVGAATVGGRTAGGSPSDVREASSNSTSSVAWQVEPSTVTVRSARANAASSACTTYVPAASANVYVPSISVEVTPRTTSPALTVIVTPGRACPLLAAVPERRQDGGGAGEAPDVAGAWRASNGR